MEFFISINIQSRKSAVSKIEISDVFISDYSNKIFHNFEYSRKFSPYQKKKKKSDPKKYTQFTIIFFSLHKKIKWNSHFPPYE